MIIRHAAMEDLKAVTELEAKCFPAAEAAGRAAFFDRLASFPDHFWLLYEDEKLVSMINGMATDEEHLTDAMYEHADMHSKDGAWQMIFGVNTIPSCRHQGYAGRLLQQAITDAKKQGRKGLVLTCKDALIPYYAKFGFVNEGISTDSTHGNAVWYQMRLTFITGNDKF